MKIIISSDIPNGTIVSTEFGKGIFKADSLIELTLFLEGIKKECPNVEFVFQNYPPRGAVFETGRDYGKKIKEEGDRYHVYFTEKGLIVTIQTGGLSSCLELFKQYSNDSKIENFILFDRIEKTVEIFKGAVEPFKLILNRVLPGWKVGKIKRN